MIINKKVFGLTLAIALVLALPMMASAAVIGNINLSPSATVNQSGNLSLSGNCGSTAANGNVTFQLNNNGNLTTIGSSTTTNASGEFNSNVTIPSDFATGSSTIIATCPNGIDTVTSSVTVNAPIGTSLNLGGATPTIGQSLNLSGVCGTTSAGGNVSVNLVRQIGTTSLGTTTTTGANGNFTGNFIVPSNAGGGPVTIVATCPTGTISFNTSIVDPNANVSVGNTNPTAGGSLTVNGVCGNQAGRPVSILLSNANRQVELGSTTTTTNGSFNTTVSVPGAFAAGNATVVAFCPTGNVVTATVNIAQGTNTDDDNNDDNGDVGGVSTDDGTGTSTTPQGGVAAGLGINFSIILALALLIAGITGLAASKRMQSDSNVV